MLVILATFSGAIRKNIAATNTAIVLFALASLRRRATLENELVLLHITELDAIRSAATNSIFSIAIDPQKFGTMASGAFPAGRRASPANSSLDGDDGRSGCDDSCDTLAALPVCPAG